MINLEYYLNKRINGTDYTELREELVEEGYSANEIKEFINEIDEKHIEFIKTKKNRSISSVANGIISFIIGVVLLIFGVSLLILGLINGSGVFSVVLIVGSLSIGSWQFILGYKALKLALKKSNIKTYHNDIII